MRWMPNARGEPRPEAGATQERTLEAVRCSALLGLAHADQTISPPTVAIIALA
jgi:hypothetical protein